MRLASTMNASAASGSTEWRRLAKSKDWAGVLALCGRHPELAAMPPVSAPAIPWNTSHAWAIDSQHPWVAASVTGSTEACLALVRRYRPERDGPIPDRWWGFWWAAAARFPDARLLDALLCWGRPLPGLHQEMAHHAAFAASDGVLRWLWKAGADLTGTAQGLIRVPILLNALSCGHAALVRDWLAAQRDPKETARRLAVQAASWGLPGAFVCLKEEWIGWGGNPQEMTFMGNARAPSPLLHVALRSMGGDRPRGYCWWRTVAAVIEAGVDVHRCDREGRTALQVLLEKATETAAEAKNSAHTWDGIRENVLAAVGRLAKEGVSWPPSSTRWQQLQGRLDRQWLPGTAEKMESECRAQWERFWLYGCLDSSISAVSRKRRVRL